MVATDIVYYNAISENGGSIDLASPITTGQLNNLFPNVNALEAEAGGKKYRKLFIKNTHGLDTALALSVVMTRFSDADDFMNFFVATEDDEIGNIEESIGVGDDATVTFGVTLTTTPILPNSVSVEADGITGNDNGLGVITGTGITVGSIDYATGIISITFDTAPANAIDVLAKYRDTVSDKMYGIAQGSSELDRGTYLVDVTVEGSQTLSDIFSDGDIIHFIDNVTGQKIVKATIDTGGVGTDTLKIIEDIPAEVVLNGSFISNTHYVGDLSAGEVVALWIKETIPPYCQSYTNSYFGVSSIFASS